MPRASRQPLLLSPAPVLGQVVTAKNKQTCEDLSYFVTVQYINTYTVIQIQVMKKDTMTDYT